MSRLNFQVQAQCEGTRARAAKFTTLHGEVETPIFMPVGTQATVKSQTAESLVEAGSNVLLANAYHLFLRPGPEVFRKMGGIHRFMNWKKPVLTDSGGFQIFSLPHSRKLDEDGAVFKNYINGNLERFSPEISIGMQKAIGSDIMMVLDQCVPSTVDRAEAEAAMHLTHRWAKRSLAAREDSPQALFGIVQGACFQDLRKQSAEFLTGMPFDGFAIGGLAVGETKQEREDFTEFSAALLPTNLPRYLMGVGTPIDILEAVHRGVDMFDCILPSALAQRGVAFTSVGKLQLRRSYYKFSEEALDPACGCHTCNNFSRAYLHHLNKCDEVLGWRLLASHNLTFYHQLMREMRQAIFEGTFPEYYREQRHRLVLSDGENASPVPKKRKSKRPSVLGDYEVHASDSGFFSIRQVSSGEVMHSVNDPAAEAEALYIRQLRLQERLLSRESKETHPLVVWDVGMGAANNSMAAIRCAEAISQPTRPLVLVSFESDLDSLRLALKHPGKFTHLRHSAPTSIIQTGSWTSKTIQWTLLNGNFLELLSQAPTPDLIFYDPFSFKTDSELWSVGTFRRIFESCVKNPEPVTLATYSASTSVRAALLASGFYVAQGVSTGPKTETTLAFSRPTTQEFLGPSWLDRWNRSDAKYPMSIELSDREGFEKIILSHPQWTQTSSQRVTGPSLIRETSM